MNIPHGLNGLNKMYNDESTIIRNNPMNYTSIEYRDRLYILGYVGFTMQSLNFLSTFYIFFRFFERWRSGKTLSMAHKVPFFMAFTELYVKSPTISIEISGYL